MKPFFLNEDYNYINESIISDFKKKIKERKQKKRDKKDEGKIIVETEWTFTSFSSLDGRVFWSLRNLNKGLNMGIKDMHKAPIFVDEFDRNKGDKGEIRIPESEYNDILESTNSSGEHSFVGMFERMKKDAEDRYKELSDEGKKLNKNKHKSYVSAMDFLIDKMRNIHRSYKSGRKGRVGGSNTNEGLFLRL